MLNFTIIEVKCFLLGLKSSEKEAKHAGSTFFQDLLRRYFAKVNGFKAKNVLQNLGVWFWRSLSR